MSKPKQENDWLVELIVEATKEIENWKPWQREALGIVVQKTGKVIKQESPEINNVA